VAMTAGSVFGHVASTVSEVGAAMFGAFLIASCAVLAARVWRSTGVERQQLKWVAYVVSLLAVVGPLATFFYDDSVLVQIGNHQPGLQGPAPGAPLSGARHSLASTRNREKPLRRSWARIPQARHFPVRLRTRAA
jgi:hypothetical protein